MKLITTVVSLVLIACHPTPSYADTFGSSANRFDIEFVTIGDPGNPADTTGNPNPAGSVSYAYRIGKYEISEQMIDNANSLGGLGITKDARGPDKPATSISWFEAAKFVNWLNTSTGNTPAYKLNFDVGVNFQLWEPSDPGYDPSNFYRNSLARYFLPSVDEWYKAAYFDPVAGEYYDYPTGSDNAPTHVASGVFAGTAIYGLQIGPADITVAGGLSPYGTMAQGGNAMEWEETEIDRVNDNLGDTRRGLRGGYFFNPLAEGLSADSRGFSSPFLESDRGGSPGFRIASIIPEPSTALLGCLATIALRLPRHWKKSLNTPTALARPSKCSLP